MGPVFEPAVGSTIPPREYEGEQPVIQSVTYSLLLAGRSCRTLSTCSGGGQHLRIYFHLKNAHEAIHDPDGIEVADLEEALTEAIKAIEEVLRQDPCVAGSWSGWTLDVAERSGAVLFSVAPVAQGEQTETIAMTCRGGFSLPDALLHQTDNQSVWQCSECGSRGFEALDFSMANAVVRCARCATAIGSWDEFLASIEARIVRQKESKRQLH